MPKGFRTRSLVVGGAMALLVAAGSTAEARGDLVASRSACNGQANQSAPEPRQEDAMRCLISHARDRAGVGHLSSHRKLERAAGRKQRDVVDCGFSHTACGLQADLYPHRTGYTAGTTGWVLGENLAWGSGSNGTARNVLKAWLSSPGHRATMLDGTYDDLGIGLYRGRFAGRSNTAVWVLQVGCRGC